MSETKTITVEQWCERLSEFARDLQENPRNVDISVEHVQDGAALDLWIDDADLLRGEIGLHASFTAGHGTLVPRFDLQEIDLQGDVDEAARKIRELGPLLRVLGNAKFQLGNVVVEMPRIAR